MSESDLERLRRSLPDWQSALLAGGSEAAVKALKLLMPSPDAAGLYAARAVAEAWRLGLCASGDATRWWLVVPLPDDQEIEDALLIDVEATYRWRLKLGVWEMLDGEAMMPGREVRLHRHPLAWLKGGGSGACLLLEPLRAAGRVAELLDGAGALICDDEAQAAEVHAALARGRREFAKSLRSEARRLNAEARRWETMPRIAFVGDGDG